MKVICKTGLGIENIAFEFKLYPIFKTGAQTGTVGIKSFISTAFVKLIGAEVTANEPGAA